MLDLENQTTNRTIKTRLLSNNRIMKKAIIREAQVPELLDLHGLKDFKIKNKRQVLRNCVLPELGLHIFNCAKNIYNKSNTSQAVLEL